MNRLIIPTPWTPSQEEVLKALGVKYLARSALQSTVSVEVAASALNRSVEEVMLKAAELEVILFNNEQMVCLEKSIDLMDAPVQGRA